MNHLISIRKSLLNGFSVCRCLSVFLIVGLLFAATSIGQIQTVRDSIERSVPFIEAKGNAWIKEQKCISCHQVPFMVWSLNSANQRGFDVDQENLDRTNKWTTEWINLTNPKRRKAAKEKATLLAENDALAQLLIGRAPVLQADPAIEDETSEDWIGHWHAHLLESQLPEGAWKAGGQLPLQKRPKRETQEVSTIWALLALKSYDERETGDAEVASKAKEWLGEGTVGESTEWWSVQLLLAQARNEASIPRWQTDLRKHQNEDGGWGFRCDEQSDAFGTGVAVYALVRSGVSASDLGIQRALEFLTATQKPDGSWTVNGTKTKANNKPTATAIYWGTCWAVIGMMETLQQE